MTAQIQVYRGITRTVAGVTKSYGNLSEPLADFASSSSSGPSIDDSVLLLAGETKTLWEYGVNSYGWDFGRVEVEGGTGTAYLWWKGDTATSATDLTATGAAITWNGVILTEKGGQEWTTRTCTTNANAVDHTSNNSGVPTAFSDLGEVAGYIYKVVAKNPGTTDIRLRRIFLG